jgi:phenylacetate-CoA ligase
LVIKSHGYPLRTSNLQPKEDANHKLMENHHNSLLHWPHQAPSAALQCLADADFIRALELGPVHWWQSWQEQRLAGLLQWVGHSSLSQLPIQRRQNYRAQFESGPAHVPDEHGAMAQFQSSGSAGVPVRFWRTDLATRINLSHYWADHQRQGRDLHKSMAVITGTPGEHEGSHKELKGDPWLHPGRQLARNSPQFTMDEHAQWVCVHAPNYLVTTPATLSSIISIIEINRIKAPRIEQIMTSSHAVEPELRVRTRRVFGASIRDRYSCEELGPIAFQCPESDDFYHVAVANVVVEVVDERGQAVTEGALGNILVTGLHQWATPALRYELGDIAALHNYCPGCGASVPALSQLMGRKYFLLHSPGQGLRHVRILAEHWLACAPVREHRVVQTSPDAFRAEVVLDQAMTDSERRALLTMLAQLIGPEFTLELVQLNAIPWTSSKRHEFVGLTT